MRTANRKHLTAALQRVEQLGRARVIDEAMTEARAMRLGDKIKHVREAIGETQDQFAEGVTRVSKLPFSVWALRSIEQGKKREYLDPHWSTIQAIALYLGVREHEFRNLFELEL